MAAEEQDRLRAVNDALRADPAAMAAQSTAWLPLESNPSILNAYSRRVGLGAEWTWVDVWGLDDEILQAQGLLAVNDPAGDSNSMRVSGNNNPPVVAALLLLFPCSRRIYEYRAREERTLRENAEGKCGVRTSFPKMNDDAFFLEQVANFGNACGTIAATHALSNCFQPFESSKKRVECDHRQGGGDEDGRVCGEESFPTFGREDDEGGTDAEPIGLASNAPLARFISKNAGRSPRDIGRALFEADDLKESSDAAASSEEAQTDVPSRDADPLDHHFVAFVRRRRMKVNNTPGHDDVLLELDGTKAGPIEHCLTSPESFVRDVAEVVRRNWIRVDPSNVEFSLMALCWDGATTK
uniref:ubiquitinyl hydrolase 1 n=1 Tax=Odontella aurita TaxID=265563 RepID=A0A7S4JNR8_9STRA|mmetsp:Transcript_50360/g.151676  ORF Transcript_50360/g.151676 Transcript_50360/m.151676 type:complete len:354 (+) Transcript_50360:145-1206(+)